MNWKSPRQKTAIHHPNNLSVAASRALLRGVIKKSSITLDYGCGHGDDVRLLKKKGYRWVTGWDPAFRSAAEALAVSFFGSNDRPSRPANVVLLSNVINIIEDPKERKCVLLHAFSLATECLVVTAYTSGRGKKWGDGVRTSIGTFQKPYTLKRFRAFIRNTFRGVPCRIEFTAGAVAFVYTKEVGS